MAKRIKIPNERLQVRILKYIRENGPTPRKVIAEDFGVSQAIITQTTRHLIERGLIYEKEEGKGSKKGGRRPIYLDINPEKGYLMALDIGSYEIKGGIGNLKCEIIKEAKTKTDRKDTIDQIIEFSRDLSKGYKENLVGILIGLPGVVDIERGISILSANLPTINNTNFRRIFQKEYRVNTKVLNSSILRLIGISWLLKNEKENILNLDWGNGISATFLSDHKEITTGKTKYRIDFGHITIDKNGKLCRCGKRGCLESYIGGESILNRVRERIKRDIEFEEIKEIIDRDEGIKEIFKEAGYMCGRYLSFPVQYFLPELIIFSGGMIKNFKEILIDEIKRGLKDTMDDRQFEKLRFEIIDTEYSGVIGGIILGTEDIFSNNLYKLYQI